MIGSGRPTTAASSSRTMQRPTTAASSSLRESHYIMALAEGRGVSEIGLVSYNLLTSECIFYQVVSAPLC